jgi:glyoxylase-like metal-dependent hydrolase (beta-lactamase superfamily II)
MSLERITEHVWWMPPGPPDRPSLCVVAGERRTVMLDGGSSPAHTREFLDGLAAAGVAPPDAVVYTHFHWDHVLGAAEIGGLVIAHRLTVDGLADLAARDWSDDGLERRVADGLSSPDHAAHVKEELPSPRSIEIVPADVVFDHHLDLDLGDVTVRVQHVAGEHSADSCVMFVEPDGMLFLGDATCGPMSAAAALALRETVFGFGARHFVEGHHEAVSSRAELEEYFQTLL